MLNQQLSLLMVPIGVVSLALRSRTEIFAGVRSLTFVDSAMGTDNFRSEALGNYWDDES